VLCRCGVVLVVSCVVLFLLCVCVCGLFLFFQRFTELNSVSLLLILSGWYHEVGIYRKD